MFKLGDKVKIINKSYYGNLENSYVYKRGRKKGIWYICTIEEAHWQGKKIIRYAVTYMKDSSGGGDYFLENDLLPFNYDLLEDELFEI